MCVRVCVCARVWAVRRLMDDGGASTAEWVDSWFPSQEPSLAHTLSSIAGDPAPGSRRSATEGDLQKEKKKKTQSRATSLPGFKRGIVLKLRPLPCTIVCMQWRELSDRQAV